MTPAGFRNFPGPLPRPYDRERAERVRVVLDGIGTALNSGDFCALAEAAAGNSPYLARLISREADFLCGLAGKNADAVLNELTAEALAVADAENMAAAMARLRTVKRRVALSIALADIGSLYDLKQVTGALTRFADGAVRGALRFLLRQAAPDAGLGDTPVERLEETTGLIVLAMGKHGAFELNYSSDIDLVVFYEAERFPFTTGGEKQRAAVGLVKGLVKLLADVTADGYVFRVDLRLRPDAGATQIAISASAAEEYYELMGQNWERAAMIKARAVAGDPAAGAQFLKNMVPFVWRKYLDYAAIEDIHSIKRQIHAHGGHGRVTAQGHDIKLGRGGIREIEFFVQTQQLILGGRDPSLRDPTTLGALAALRARGLISEMAEDELKDAYVFLRMLEHRLQMIEDQQTHMLPKTSEEMDRIACFMGYDGRGTFENVLLEHLRRVEHNYSLLFEREAPLAAEVGSLVFTGVEDDPETVKTLGEMGFRVPRDVARIIRGWHHGRVRATRSARAREILTKLMPALLKALAGTADPQIAFANFDRFLAALPSGVQVLSLLFANPGLLDLVAEIAGSAPRLAGHLGSNASVLDALIDPEFMTEIPGLAELQQRFAAELARLPGFEGALDAARRFAREEMFRIGVQVIRGTALADRAGPAYAAIAETVIAGLHPAVVAEMEAAHGCVPDGAFAVTALGKLGGREMTAASDLDLVFVYTHAPDAAGSDGKRPLSVGQYFARTAQRFITALTALTAEGRLYDVDMRLRPSGNQGPVAVRFDSFEDYHATKTWTWERMALTRARVLSGPEHLRAKIEAVISAALRRGGSQERIRKDGREMRDKLAREFPGADAWDLKFAPGGLVDIEFIAQTLQLCHAGEHDVLDQNTVRALEKLARAGTLSPDDAKTLIAAANLEHALTQVLRICLDGPFTSDSASPGLKALLVRAAKADDFVGLETDLIAAQWRVREIFERILPPV